MNKCVICKRDESALMSRAFAWLTPEICIHCAEQCRGLSLWQPWAGFIALGLKRIETRFWHTHYRGDLLICSSRRFERHWRKISSAPDAEDIDVHCRMTGWALAVARLVECRPMQLRDAVPSMVRYEPSAGRYSWVLDDIRPIVPFGVIGRQGLFKINRNSLDGRKAV